MLTCPTHLPIYFCTAPVDFRKSFDGLVGVITTVFQANVLDGHLFLCNRPPQPFLTVTVG